MSIIKSIMHKFNGTDYDTLHPETEHAQVTDFGQGVVTHLLAGTLASTVTAVTSGSLFGKMVKLLLDATGCKYLMAQNGYICFGSLFGGLILQWGVSRTPSGNAAVVVFPLSFSNTSYIIIPVGAVSSDDTTYTHTVNVISNISKSVSSCLLRTSSASAPTCWYIAVGC